MIQRRVDGRENFNRLWHDYVAGFGSSQADYWAGLNSIYYLTNHQGKTMTKFECVKGEGGVKFFFQKKYSDPKFDGKKYTD